MRTKLEEEEEKLNTVLAIHIHTHYSIQSSVFSKTIRLIDSLRG